MATSQTQVESQAIQQTGISRWWRVVGGLSMNLALGTLYAWSVFVAPLERQFGWRRADTSMVFTIAVMVFALTFVVAGRIQDKIGPFYCSLAGGLLDARKFVAGGGLGDGVVEDLDGRSPGLEAQPDDGGHRLRAGRGAHVGRLAPADVGLDDDQVAPPDERPGPVGPAEFLDRGADVAGGIVAAPGQAYAALPLLGRRMLTHGLLRLRGSRRRGRRRRRGGRRGRRRT
jgi:hypothetical protein